jgi:hypothetical protein
MLNYKLQAILLWCILFVLTGCFELKYNFDVNAAFSDSSAQFFKTLPGIKDGFYNRIPVTNKAKKIEVYKASIREFTFEKDNLVEFTQLNTHSDLRKDNYLEIDGSAQDLYLLKYNFSCGIDGQDFENTAVIFMSLHYMPMNTEPFVYCSGAGPAYWGLIGDGQISFDSLLTIRHDNQDYYLKSKKVKKKDAFNLRFLPAGFVENPVKNISGFNIKKVIKMNANKVGGIKPLVFNIPVIFKDDKAMHFTYIKTITLNN